MVKIVKKPSKATSKAASLMGQQSWQSRLKKYGLKKLKAMLGAAGEKSPGRSRMPDDEVKPASLYQRARRERVRKEAAIRKGNKDHGKAT
jgi:hypothetical protein